MSQPEAEIKWFYEALQDLLQLTPQKDALFIIREKNAKRGSQEIPGEMALEYRLNRAKANRVLPRERTGNNKYPLPTTQEKTTHGHHQMVNSKIRRIIFFAAKDGEALYSQQKQDWELTVAQTMNSSLPNSDLN